ncbi:MAG TPA: hypothetical protein PK986_01930 [Spirochaetota bacterium]|nr:hypothetical protein [Spirochaetota bacterium]HQO39204.1 hypothetical protein [Spirochaetota bacterium]
MISGRFSFFMAFLLLTLIAGFLINTIILRNINKDRIIDYMRLRKKVSFYSSICGLIIGRVFSGLIEGITGLPFELVFCILYLVTVTITTFSIIRYYKRPL